MDLFLIILACVLLLLGFLGCIVPLIPGPPLCYAGIIALHFCSDIEFTSSFLIFWLVVVVVICVVDYYIPIWGTKRFGGSRLGVIGSTIGLIVGLFFSPLGIIIGPFVGALLGEILAGNTLNIALRAGIGAFVGFLFGTLAKMIVSGFLIFYAIRAIYTM